jgi:tetratricopeptide (TPR) repeat protein
MRNTDSRCTHGWPAIVMIMGLAVQPAIVHAQAASAAATPTPPAVPPAPAPQGLEEVKEIAARAIDSSQHDVEDVKFIFTVMSVMFGLTGIGAGVFSYLQLNETRKKLESFGEEQENQLSDLRTILSEILQGQAFVELNLKRLQRSRLNLQALIKSAGKPEVIQATKEEIDEYASGILDVLDSLNRGITKLGSPRWRAWERGVRGVTHLEKDDFTAAVKCLIQAIEQLPRQSAENHPRLASHYYNLACAYARQYTDVAKLSAIIALQETLSLARWRWKEAVEDGDFDSIKTTVEFINLIDSAKKRT